MPDLPSWKDLGSEFQKYAEQYADLAERESPAEWAKLPQGPWILLGGSPRSARLFKEIAAKAAKKRALLCNTNDTEHWQLWLSLMWTEGWRCPEADQSSAAASRPRQVSWHQYKIDALDEVQRIQRIFQTSADCCADFEDRETDQSEPLVSEAIGAKPQRRWSIVTEMADQKKQKNLRERFEQVVREALAELGYRFRDPLEAIESWLDFLLRESAYSRGTAIAELGDASKHELAELKVLARESGNGALAATLGRLEAQCEFPKSLHAILRVDFCRLPQDIRLRAASGPATESPGEGPLAQNSTTQGKGSGGARAAKEVRAKTVGQIVKELNALKPQMFEDEPEYNRLRSLYPDFLTFKIAEQRPDLKLKVLAIGGSTRHLRLAQEIAAAHHGRQLSTIQDDWKDHKPLEFRRPR